MTNGGTPYRNQILLVTSGRAELPPSMVLVNPYPPYNDTVLLYNFYGRQFNSLNDIMDRVRLSILLLSNSLHSHPEFPPPPRIVIRR